jgi:glycosidase
MKKFEWASRLNAISTGVSVVAVAILTAVQMAAQSPVVAKVEPPNWWIGHTINPVRLLIRGQNLAGASIDAPRGLRAGRINTNSRGTYLFVDVEISKQTKPGDYPLTVRTKGGSASIPFRLEPPVIVRSRFHGFSRDDIIYLIMPDRFANGDTSNDDPAISKGLLNRAKPRYYHGGDLQGIIDRLPYLKDLGVTALWVTPIYDNNNHLNEKEKYDGQAIADYHGYGAIDYYAVEEHLGTMATLQKLIDEAHRQGLKVIQDQVENHVGPYHPWVDDPPTPNWFHGNAAAHVEETWQIWTLADPYSAISLRRAVVDGWFLNILPDMNQEDPEVARYQIQNTLWWLGAAGFDSIRQDTWPYVSRAFWRDWMQAIKKQFPDMTVVGEVFDADPALVSFFQGGKTQYDGIDDMVDSVFDFPTYFKIREVFGQGGTIHALANTLGHDHLYAAPDRLVTFLGLHDVQRFMNEPSASVDRLKLAFTYLLTSRGIPMIYYGDEIGMLGANDPDNRRDFPGGWPDDRQNAFLAEQNTPEQRAVLNHVKTLTHLRLKVDCLRRGATQTLAATSDTLAYARRTKSELAVVVINAGGNTGIVKIALSDLGIASLAKWRPQLRIADAPTVGDSTAQVVMPPNTGEVYLIDNSLSR